MTVVAAHWCDFCGAPIARGHVCGSHADVARIDRHVPAERAPRASWAWDTTPGRVASALIGADLTLDTRKAPA